MCGITGFWNPSRASLAELQAVAWQMAQRLTHRGPDDSGLWVDATAGLALGFQRLAILDLSQAGHQPMLSASGRYVIVFNGEIYNFGDLRAELQGRGYRFRGHSDTEAMLAAIEEWGLEAAVSKFVGMFGFALWDRQERSLHLVRDRLGIKPLYYGWAGKSFLFGSELKALRACPDWAPEISRDALALQMQYSYIPQPHSIYKGIQKLAPGCILTVPGGSLGESGGAAPRPYWSAREIVDRAAGNPLNASVPEAVEQLDSLLREAVRLRMIAHVPLGAFLSGGVDSSTVVALMQAQSSRPVKTYTIGFCESQYDEARDARAVAAHLGTDHTELYLTPQETLAVIPKLPLLFDEPFSDSSQVPTYLLSALARGGVTVSLSGDGGDELFGGYNRYFWSRRIWKAVNGAPWGIRAAAAGALQRISPRSWDRVFSWLEPLLPWRFRLRLAGDKIDKFAKVLPARNPEEFYLRLVSQWRSPADIVLGSSPPAHLLGDPSQWPNISDFTRLMMFLDLVSYLPDDILTKVDRASMAVGLEVRVPLLDHRVVEFAGRLPLNMKIHKGLGKWLLRQVLYRYVPSSLIERPKMGFGIPLGKWLRGTLREWAEDLLQEDRLKREGYLRPGPIRRIWAEHLAGQRNWEHSLWPVLMFQAWREQWA